jgi:RNA polymerase sigma-70 factor, ECF subfamily
VKSERPADDRIAQPAPGPARADPDVGGRAGFDELYQVFYGRLTAQVHAYLGDRAEAEDVVQETFVRAWQRWSTVSRYDDPAAWLRRVAWNLATSRLRRLAVALRAQRRDEAVQVAAPPDPNHVALVAALRQLPERQRLAVVLHYLADLPIADVAVEMAVPKGTVLTWLHRGRARLATCLSDADNRRHHADTGGDK